MAQPQQTEAKAEMDQTDRADAQDEAQDEAPEQAESQELAEALAAAESRFESERAEMRDRLMRAFADLENTRKRAEKDRRDAAIYGGSKLARDLLPVFDNLSRALAAADDQTRAQAKGLVDGVELTLRELINVLGRHGVERVSPEPGDPFDPHLHEAMFEAPVQQFAAGQVIQVVTDGFRMHDQLLRPAQVGVSSRPAG